MAESTLRVTDLLDELVMLDVECLDRIYVNGYLPTLQTPGGVVLPEASRVSDCLTGADGEDRHQVPPVGGQVR